MTSFFFFKTLHLIEYGVLFWLTERALRFSFAILYRQIRLGRWHFALTPALLALLFVVLYGASDEFHQTLIPTREGKIRDVMIDGLGGLLAWWIGVKRGWYGKT